MSSPDQIYCLADLDADGPCWFTLSTLPAVTTPDEYRSCDTSVPSYHTGPAMSSEEIGPRAKGCGRRPCATSTPLCRSQQNHPHYTRGQGVGII